MKRLIFTVTNDLTYDQRMSRICESLALNRYHVELVGRRLPESVTIEKKSFKQTRLRCFFTKGFMFYAEFNTRLFFYLLFRKHDLLCAIDLDTILPVLAVSAIRTTKRVYDAHELFCEMKEIVSRPSVYRTWKSIEKFAVPRFSKGYTVNDVIANEFARMYGVQYNVIRNIPRLSPIQAGIQKDKFVLYQGAVNEGRCFETLIPAFNYVNAKLVICGDGNFMEQAKQITTRHHLHHKIVFKGKIPPAELKTITLSACIGITLFDDVGLSNYYSLANRFFDYMHAGTPQVCVDFPVYRNIVNEYPFALLIKELDSASIASAINRLLQDKALYDELASNCLQAREALNWQNEEKVLLSFYNEILPGIE